MLVAAAVLAVVGPGRTRAGELPGRDFATVGSIVVRKVEGRTVVVIPISGPVRPKLSEPFRVANRWRLYLTIEDARMSIRGSRINKPEGVLAISVAEVSGDVRLTVDVKALGDYGARRSEEGLILWIDENPRPVMAASPAGAPVEAPAPVAPGRASASPAKATAQPTGGGGRGFRMAFLAILAAGGGWALQWVRRNGTPEWAQAIGPGLRALAFGKKPTPPAAPARPQAAGRAPVIDPRGRSADIGDAFRVEPETPPSGIAALATPDQERNEE
jgi:hypothetical protein